MKQARLNNVKVHVGSYETFLFAIADLASQRVPSYVCFANAHMLVEAWQDAGFTEILSKATLVCPDGKPLSFVLSKLLQTPQERVCGMDMVPDLITMVCRDEMKIFFVGPNEETITAIKCKLASEFIGNKCLAGYYIPSVGPDSSNYNEKIIQMINKSGADLVFVSLGCPKQERWMYNHYHEISAPLLGIGGALPVYAGIQKRAPVWMQRLALEWLYRLCQEPRRLFKRYFITNTLFVYNAIKILLKRNAVISSCED